MNCNEMWEKFTLYLYALKTMKNYLYALLRSIIIVRMLSHTRGQLFIARFALALG